MTLNPIVQELLRNACKYKSIKISELKKKREKKMEWIHIDGIDIEIQTRRANWHIDSFGFRCVETFSHWSRQRQKRF